MRELALGARLTLAGGRTGLMRTAITAIGVALGVAVLLVAASIPAIHDGRQARDDERLGISQPDQKRGDLLAGDVGSEFRGATVRGRLLEAIGPKPPVPPGLDRLPRRGEVFVSPALGRLLATPDGRRLLAPRIPGRVAGTIAPSGLLAPTELGFYAGATGLQGGEAVRRIERFGPLAQERPLDPVLGLLVVIVLVALLLPVAVLVGAAVRTGGEERDRRLAALRLVGADQRMTRRIAAGEALVAAGIGVVVGGIAFLALRGLADRISLFNVSVYSADVRPSVPLTLLVLAGVPAGAVAVSLLALRRVVAEPLGVVRRTDAPRRRLWWRLLLPAVGLAALAPAAGQDAERISEGRVGLGVVTLLVGVAALLPWVVERAVARLGAGKVAWQLAVRRLQLDPGGPARAVSGITVAVAGAIALQMVFTGVQEDYKTETGADLARATMYANFDGGVPAATAVERLASVPGVRSAVALAQYDAGDSTLTVAPCATLREVAGVKGCRDGDVFFAGYPERRTLAVGTGTWQVPAGARTVPTREDPTGLVRSGVFATPAAVRDLELPAPFVFTYVRTDVRDQDADENVRNAAAALSPLAEVRELRRTRTDAEFAQLRRAMLVGASLVIGLIGLSLLLTALEQLRERRRLLAVLVAFGTRRSTLSWSILWQSALPVAFGLVIAVATGLALGAVLLRIVGAAVAVAWADVAGMAAVGAAVVLLVTAASLPVLWRTMRPEGLRTE
jgi:hypothetical protein